MPVYWKMRIKKGWKKEENKRKGPCLVAIPCDEKTDKEQYFYAPNLVDEAFFKDMFEKLKVLDELNKARVKTANTLKNIDRDIDLFTKSINTTQTTKNWNDTCRLKAEEKKK